MTTRTEDATRSIPQSPAFMASRYLLLALLGLCLLCCSFTGVGAQCLEEDTEELTVQYAWNERQSAGFPGSYESNLDVCWVLSPTDAEHHIQLEVTDTAIEPSEGCQNADYVEIRDGSDDQSTLLDRFCGNVRPSIWSTGPALYIRFHTNAQVTDRGFRFRYRAVSNFTALDSTTPDIVRVQDGICGETINLEADHYARELRSPGYPNSYAGGLSVCWVIESETARDYIEILVEDSHMEYNLFCTDGDYVELREGGSRWGFQLRQWCGSAEPSRVTSETSSILVHFHTDADDNNYRGFKLNYRAYEFVHYPSGNDTRTYIGLGCFIVLAIFVCTALTIRRKYFLKGRVISTVHTGHVTTAPPICAQRPSRRRASVLVAPGQPPPHYSLYSIGGPPDYSSAMGNPAYPTPDSMYMDGKNGLYPESSGGVNPPPLPAQPPPYEASLAEPPPPYAQNQDQGKF